MAFATRFSGDLTALRIKSCADFTLSCARFTPGRQAFRVQLRLVGLPLSESVAFNGRVPASQILLLPDPRPLVERLAQDIFRQLPERPGVYLMRDAVEVVLYVGKAKSLRHRLNSYRVANPDRMGRRHLRLLRQVARIELLELCG
jgi:hypothetical protein